MEEQRAQIPGGELEGVELTQDPEDQVGEEGVKEGTIAAEAASAQNGDASHVVAPAEPEMLAYMKFFMGKMMAEMKEMRESQSNEINKVNGNMDAMRNDIENQIGGLRNDMGAN